MSTTFHQFYNLKIFIFHSAQVSVKEMDLYKLKDLTSHWEESCILLLDFQGSKFKIKRGQGVKFKWGVCQIKITYQ